MNPSTSATDSDWFLFALFNGGTVSWTVNAEFPASISIVNISNCASPLVLAAAK